MEETNQEQPKKPAKKRYYKSKSKADKLEVNNPDVAKNLDNADADSESIKRTFTVPVGNKSAEEAKQQLFEMMNKDNDTAEKHPDAKMMQDIKDAWVPPSGTTVGLCDDKVVEETKKTSAELSEVILQKLDVLKQIMPIVVTEQPIGILTYLDYAYDNEKKPISDGPNVVGLQVFTKSAQVETFSESMSVTTEQLYDLNKKFGIDVLTMCQSMLINEIVTTLYKSAINKIKELAALNTFKVKLTIKDKIVRFVKSLFKKPFKKNVVVDNTRQIISKILMASSRIAINGRMGAGNYIICSCEMATRLKNDPGFAFAQNNKDVIGLPFYHIGNIGNSIRVYVDNNMKWDNTVYVGRTNDADQPGVMCMFYKYGSSVVADATTMSPRISMYTRYANIQTGFYPERNFMKIDFELSKNFTA